MSVEFIEPPKSKIEVKTSILVGLLNALLWIILGARVFWVAESQDSIWWILFHVVLNLGVAFAISQQHTRHFRRSYWVAGVTLFVAIVCALIFGFWFSYDADFGGLALLLGVGLGSFIGLFIGFVIGTSTSPSQFSRVDIIQRIGEGMVTSTIVGLIISVISIFIMATSEGLHHLVDNPDYFEFVMVIIFDIFVLVPAGVIPSVITGLTTTFMIYAMNWWLKRQSPIQHRNVG
jgi:hypothetical protein